ncbi:unnamed protein product [Enterobius vermicularis]|uniref:G_PROTEIN_RECEP_F1_2 domain-containing protein n=1 Tax=Enterobius vermicularis TaxID=51028 RepID=A0A0N4VRC3_ENTVE|nr:unnamed protein product [Enterobius vermicularis]
MVCKWDLEVGYRQTLAYAYIIVDCAGFFSNIWVLQVVWPLLFSKSFRIPKSIMFYIVVLCFSDLCTMIGLIFVILDMIRGMWIFGEIACDVYLLVEACNKFFPPFIVVLISRTCYKTVCQDAIERKKASSMNVSGSNTFAVFQTAIALAIVLAIVLPHLLYSGTLDIIVAHDNITMTATYLLRCSFLPPPVAEMFFDIISFIVSYFIPLIGTIYYFVSVPLFLKKRAENSIAWSRYKF